MNYANTEQGRGCCLSTGTGLGPTHSTRRLSHGNMARGPFHKERVPNLCSREKPPWKEQELTGKMELALPEDRRRPPTKSRSTQDSYTAVSTHDTFRQLPSRTQQTVMSTDQVQTYRARRNPLKGSLLAPQCNLRHGKAGPGNTLTLRIKKCASKDKDQGQTQRSGY